MTDLLATPEMQRAWLKRMWELSEGDPVFRLSLLASFGDLLDEILKP